MSDTNDLKGACVDLEAAASISLQAVAISLDPVPTVKYTGSGHTVETEKAPTFLNNGEVLVRWLCAPLSATDLHAMRSPRDFPTLKVP